MPVPVEIPPETRERLANGFAAAVGLHTSPQLRSGKDQAGLERLVDATIEVLAEPLFASWSERLASDEAIGAAGLALATETGKEYVFVDRSGLYTGARLAYRLSAAKAIGAALAAVSGKDGADD